MKKRFLAFLLAVCVAVSMLVLPASAVGSNAAVQTATALGGLTAGQAGSLGAPLTRGQAARLLTAFSAYRDTTTAQGRTGRLYSDVDSDSPYAVYIRTAVQNGWMTGYSDGSFRPDTPSRWKKPAPWRCACWAMMWQSWAALPHSSAQQGQRTGPAQ